MKPLIVLASLIGATLAADAKCLKCICDLESGCRAVGCHDDVGSDSCGYYQIKLNYYTDCGAPDKGRNEDIETAWKRCADDYSCATRCTEAYIERYEHKCPSNMDSCEKASRLHNGGPGGCGKSATDKYWKKITKCYGVYTKECDTVCREKDEMKEKCCKEKGFKRGMEGGECRDGKAYCLE